MATKTARSSNGLISVTHIVCKKHPSYQVKHVPKSGCETCWVMWLAMTVLTQRQQIDSLDQRLTRLIWGDDY